MTNQPIIVDPAGDWVINTSDFPFQDPEANLRFPSNTPMKVKLSDWAKNQPVIEKTADPFAKPVEKPVEKPSQKA